MVCFTSVRFAVWPTFRALALHRSRLRDCGKISVFIVGYKFKRMGKSGLAIGWNL